MPPVNWESIISPTVNLLELVLRASGVYLICFTALRLFRREAGALGVADLLVVVLMADAAQNGLSAGYKSLPEALVLIATVVGWNYLLDWLGYHYGWARRLLQAKPLLLVRDGQAIRKNLRSELITMEDLKEQMREQGIGELSGVKKAFLEADGHMSFVSLDTGDSSPSPGSRKTGAAAS
ncbi:MAG: DUF421 domain-containing protein [Gemmatimonadota bacterium]